MIVPADMNKVPLGIAAVEWLGIVAGIQRLH